MAGPRTEWVGGRNPVYEVLRAGRREVSRIRMARGVDRRGRVREILDLAQRAGVQVDPVPREELDRLASGHQGVVAQVGPYPYVPLGRVLRRLEALQGPALLLLLDLLQDPQNFGTLLRTAEAVGVDGVIIPLRRAVGVTPAVVSSSAGASEHLPIARANLASAMARLKEQGVWMVGLELANGAEELWRAPLGSPLAVVVGSEGKGLRRLVRERCDFLVRLPMLGKVDSLNAAVAGSIALYAVVEARMQAEAPSAPRPGLR